MGIVKSALKPDYNYRSLTFFYKYLETNFLSKKIEVLCLQVYHNFINLLSLFFIKFFVKYIYVWICKRRSKLMACLICRVDAVTGVKRGIKAIITINIQS